MDDFLLFASFLCVFGLSVVASSVIDNIQNQPHLTISQNVDNSAELIFKILDEASDELEFYDAKDVIVILETSNSDATALSLFLLDADLKAVATDGGSNEFRIEDDNGLNGSSRTVIPTLMNDEQMNIFYYDFSEFHNSSSVANNIATNFFLCQLLNFVNSVKFLFTLRFDAMKIGADKSEFMAFAKSATKFIKNIGKYQNGIALVVTMVKTMYEDGGGIVNDDQVVAQIGKFLNQVMDDLNASDPQVNAKIISFIGILLKKDSNTNQYNRIKIQRLPSQAGLLKDMDVQRNSKNAIITMIQNTLEYVGKEDADFEYAILDKSNQQLLDIFDEFETRLDYDVCRIANEIIEFYAQQEEATSDIGLLYEKLKLAHQKVSEIDSNELDRFEMQLTDAMAHLQLQISSENEIKIKSDIQFAQFLKSMDNGRASDSFEPAEGLANAKQQLFESKEWYAFLINLHTKLSEMSSQENMEMYDTPSTINKITKAINQMSQNESKHFKEVDISEFLSRIDSEMYLRTENLRINPRKLKLLRTLLHQAMHSNLVTVCTTDKLSVSGYNVKLSDVAGGNVKFIEIFALNKFYVDTEFKHSEMLQQISIITPNWEVIGNASIILDGVSVALASDFLGVADTFTNIQDDPQHNDGHGNESMIFFV